MMNKISLKLTIFIGGLVVLICTTAASFISHRFIFGIAHLERPIVEFVVISLIGFAAYFLVFERIRLESKESLKKSHAFFWIILISVLCRLAYYPSQFIQETDPYRYAWDGQTILKGGNPYQLSPSEARAKRGDPAKSMTPEGQLVYERINHPGIKTIYPPLAQAIFSFSQAISPWGFTGLRILIFLSEIFTLFLLGAVLKMTGRPMEWTMLYGWSPLVLKEFSNSLHVDAFAVLFLSAALYAHFRNRPVSVFIFLAFATLVKVFAAILLLPLIVYEWNKDRKRLVYGLIGYCGLILAFYFPFVKAGLSLFEGLGRFAVDWRVNEGLFGIIRWAIRIFISENLDLANQVARISAALIVFILTLGAARWVKREGMSLSVAQAWLFVVSVLFFLLPAANPWYFTWVMPFLVIVPNRSLILFSGLVSIYYLDLFFAYRDAPQIFDAFRVVEYGLFFGCLGWELWPKIKQSQLYCRFQTSAV